MAALQVGSAGLPEREPDLLALAIIVDETLKLWLQSPPAIR